MSQVCSTFPAVRLLTAEIDDRVEPELDYALVPGAGNYGVSVRRYGGA